MRHWKELSLGETKVFKKKVSKEDTLELKVDKSLPKVVATFVLVEWLEIETGTWLQGFCPESEINLGKTISIEHLSSAGSNEELTLTINVAKIHRRYVTMGFSITVAEKIIAQGSHVRYLVPTSLINESIN